MLNVLWLDDDSPQDSPHEIGGCRIFTAQTCAQAQQLLAKKPSPSWIIVDLIVPQGKWSRDRLPSTFFENPGVAFIKWLREHHHDLKIAVYSVDVSPVIDIAEELNVDLTFGKRATAFRQLLGAVSAGPRGELSE